MQTPTHDDFAPTSMPRGPGRRAGRSWNWLRANALLLALAVVSFTVAIVVHDTVFPLFSGNKDEPVYVLQAEMLGEGHATIPDEGAQRPWFQPWLTGVRDGKVFSAFPMGWPLALALTDLLVGTMAVALGLAAAGAVLAVHALARELGYDRPVALVAAALVTVSPFVIVQSGLYLSYLYTFALGVGFGACLLRGVRTGSRGALVAAGLLVGLVFLTRPFDAALWALPFGTYLLAVHRRKVGRLLRDAAWLALGALPPVALAVAYNLHISGRPLEFPITAAVPENGFGFGERRLAPTAELFDYGPADAWDALVRNVAAAPPWVPLAWVGIVLAVAGIVLRRRQASTWLLVGIAVVFPVGYLSYWGSVLMADGASGIGPQYYLPAWAAIAILAASASAKLWARWRVATAVVLAAGLVWSTATLADKLSAQRDLTDYFERVDAAIDAADLDDAVLFVPTHDEPYLMTEYPFAANGPRLDGPLLYAADLGERNVELPWLRSDRSYAVLRPEYRAGDPFDRPSYAVVHQEPREGNPLVLRATFANPGDDPVVVAHLRAGSITERRLLDVASTRGKTYEVEWRVAPPGSTRDDVVTLDDAHGSLTVGFTVGVSEVAGDAASSTGGWEVEIPFGVTGDVTRVRALVPGLGRARVPGSDVWLPAPVEPVLRVR